MTVETVNLTEEEITERVQILHKLREHLLEQRNRFYRYLEVLDREEQDILDDDVDKLKYHVELEKELAGEIITFQKVINPLNDMYKLSGEGQDAEIPKLQESLSKIQEEVEQRSERNRKLLQGRLNSIGNEIKSLKKNYKNKPVYDDFRNTPSMIDIST